MYIPNDIVNEIQSIASMELVLNHYGIVAKGSGVTKGLSCCPNCGKDYDDVKYNTAKELINCFVCKFGGNVFNVIMIKESCGFIDAVNICADIIGYVIPDQKAQKNDILQEAAMFYQLQYSNQLEHRGISKETAKLFGIGYAPGADKLVNHLLRRGFSKEDILKSGLSKVNDKGDLVDKYFKSAVFPEIRGKKVVDFYFRILDDKYKSKHQLFIGKNNMIGHHTIKGSKALAICEAPIDAASFYQLYNIPALAICGSWTKLSNSIKATIKTMNLEQVIVAFDNDDSGHIATMELIKELIDLDIEILVLNLGSSKDVNKMLTDNGSATFENGRYLYLKHITECFDDQSLIQLMKDRAII